jgi:hypothetical protein
MKKVMLAAFAGLLGLSVSAQEISKEAVPEEVMESFYEEFASAKDVEWEEVGDAYEAEFLMEDKAKTVQFDRMGEKKIVMTVIELNELPQAVQQTLKRDYIGYEHKKYMRVEEAGQTKYKVETAKAGKTEELMFDSAGKKVEQNKMDKQNKQGKK